MGKMSIDIAVSIDKNGNLISPIEIDKQVITKLGIYEICGNKYWIIWDKPAVEKAELPLCNICGGKQVYIRGKCPHADNRLTCPTCCQEKLDYLKELVSNYWGQEKQDLAQKKGLNK